MSNSTEISSHLKRLALTLRKKFGIVLHRLDEEDGVAAVSGAAEILEEVKGGASLLSEDYLNALYSQKMPAFSKDLDLLNQWKSGDTPAVNNDALLDLLGRVEAYVTTLEKEVTRQYPEKPFWDRDYSFLKKPLLVATGVFLAIWLLAFAYRLIIQSRRGLVGSYYAGANFENLYTVRKDPTVDFQWGFESPFADWAKDWFSVRWTGYLQAPRNGPYHFITHSDDGVRLFIDGKPVVTNWNPHAMAIDRGTIYLTKGKHEIKVEYFEQDHPALVRLFWKHGDMASEQIIPSKYLLPPPKK